MIVDLIHLLEFRVGKGEACELFLAQPEVVELVLEDDARVEESVGDDGMAFCFLLFGKRNLLQVVFSFVRIVFQAVFLAVSHGVFYSLHGLCERVAHGLVLLLTAPEVADHRLVRPLPVVFIFTLSPLFLESRLTLRHGELVVEIPFAFLLVGLIGLIDGLVLHAVVACVVFGKCALRFLFHLRLALLFLLLLQRLYHTVDGLVALLFRHLGESEQ